ncbi:hypothetical protein Ancab_032223 [Ancistrocladus abbreviatus]
MSRLGFKSMVYQEGACLGELETIPVNKLNFQFPNNEIRISHTSAPSERCHPLSVLQTIATCSVRCKLESSLPSDQQHLLLTLHASCFYELKVPFRPFPLIPPLLDLCEWGINWFSWVSSLGFVQTAVVMLGDEEIHLVAMPSKQKKFPCFWCYSVAPCGLYNSCLGMLNLRCLAIVFDLDETLIVANTLRSFEDRIEHLRGWISRETDPVRLSGMLAELKRNMDDRAMLKHFSEYDCVVEGGEVLKVQLEEVPNHEKFLRPVVRLQEKNIVLTRINPENHDTSVLVRLRPAWDDLRSYLTAKGRKRFEVYVCTMAERDYALEMWRLLDPEAHLIDSNQLSTRVVCVKSGSRKSLLNVFQDGLCHPNMAMVIDDRSKVWEDKDQPRVHVVPAFTPYYAPQAETANAVPVLCVARNVACNVRGGFFKEFDENLLRRISELFYEDEVSNLPSPPDVSNYLLSEDMGLAPNGNLNLPIPEGLHGDEVEQRLHVSEGKIAADSACNAPAPSVPEIRSEISQLPAVSVSNVCNPAYSRPLMPSQKPSLLGVPARRDGPSSEPDVDVRRRLMMMKHGTETQNPLSGDPPILRLPLQIPSMPMWPQGGGGWLIEEDINRGLLHNQASGVAPESDALRADKMRGYQHILGHCATPSGQLPDFGKGRVEEAGIRNEWQKQILPSQPPCGGIRKAATSQSPTSSNSREYLVDAFKSNTLPSASSISVLQEIGWRCSSKVEFRSVASTSKDLQFSMEVLFTGERIGVGMGKTRKDAQQQAAENALHSLADKYLAYVAPQTGVVQRDFDKLSIRNENGFIWEDAGPESDELSTDEKMPRESTSEAAELAPGSTSSAAANQQVQKRAKSPR